nr:hypothetical protein Iba_chr06cCG3280 [Ipomoea batatas]GMD87063.1 hypothetical protein Iba_chr14bCG12130 [Ipomoea batatas]
MELSNHNDNRLLVHNGDLALKKLMKMVMHSGKKKTFLVERMTDSTIRKTRSRITIWKIDQVIYVKRAYVYLGDEEIRP